MIEFIAGMFVGAFCKSIYDAIAVYKAPTEPKELPTGYRIIKNGLGWYQVWYGEEVIDPDNGQRRTGRHVADMDLMWVSSRKAAIGVAVKSEKFYNVEEV